MRRFRLLGFVRQHPFRWLAIGLVLAGVFYAVRPRHYPVQQQARELRDQIRAQGYKTEASDFVLNIGAEDRVRMVQLTNTGFLANRLATQLDLMPMKPIGPETARMLWRQPSITRQEGDADWPELRAFVVDHRAAFDQATAILLSGPVRSEPMQRGGFGPGLLLPHLPYMKHLAVALAVRSAVELKEGNQPRAWTNVLAASRLAIHWQTEPMDISQLIRLNLVPIAQAAIWEGLQAGGWSDGQLEQLKTEWESAEFFRTIPETAAIDRAIYLQSCADWLAEPATNHLTPFSAVLTGVVRSPSRALGQITGWWKAKQRVQNFRVQGVFEDQIAILRFFTRRENELTAAITNFTWQTMRSTAAVTNQAQYDGSEFGMIATVINMKRLNLLWSSQREGILARAAEAEIRRRLIVTALALERFRIHSGQRPASLHALVPEFLAAVPLDYADGLPLRYQVRPDGRFALYSVGLDLVDDGGRQQLPPANHYWPKPENEPPPPKTFDLIWPLPATP